MLLIKEHNFKRPSIFDLQNLLIGEDHKYEYRINFDYQFNDKSINDIKDYFHFHINQKKFNKLDGVHQILKFINKLQKFKKNIIITRDIEKI